MADFRVILIDDGSTDDTPVVLAEMAALDPRIEVHRQVNGGIVDALNAGLRLCTAEYIARLDADDLCFPNRLEVQLNHFRANPAVVAVGPAARHINADGMFLNIVARLGDPGLANPDYVPSSEPYIMHPFLTARRAAPRSKLSAVTVMSSMPGTPICIGGCATMAGWSTSTRSSATTGCTPRAFRACRSSTAG